MEDKCYYCHEIKEQGWTYEGCFYLVTESYPDECHKSSCCHFLSARKAAEIIKKVTADKVSIDTVVRWIKAARDDCAFTIRPEELDSYQKIMKALAYYRK